MAVSDLIKKDKRARKLLRMLAKGSYRFDTDRAIKEIQYLHKNRIGRSLEVKSILHEFQGKFLNSVLQTQANRSRIVEIKMQAFRIHAKLDKHTGLVRQHLKANYVQQLNRIAGTAADRESLLNNILADAISHLKDLKTTMDIGDLAILDLDQVSWSNKSIISMMEQIGERKTPKI